MRFSSCLLVRSVSMIASLVALSFRPSILSTYASRELLRACRLVTSAVVLKIDFGSGISSPLKISRYLWKKSTISRDLTAFPAICFASRLCGARLSEINSPKCFANLRRLDTILVFGILVMSHYRPWVHLLFGALEVWILRDGGARVGQEPAGGGGEAGGEVLSESAHLQQKCKKGQKSANKGDENGGKSL